MNVLIIIAVVLVVVVGEKIFNEFQSELMKERKRMKGTTRPEIYSMPRKITFFLLIRNICSRSFVLVNTLKWESSYE